jgi:hypothetical protein
MQITTVGLDLAKNVFQVHGIDAAEKRFAELSDFSLAPRTPSIHGLSRYFTAPQQLGRFRDKADTGLFTVVPNISRQLPVTSDLLPDHNVRSRPSIGKTRDGPREERTRAFVWDPISGLHQGQQPKRLHSKAEYMAAPEMRPYCIDYLSSLPHQKISRVLPRDFFWRRIFSLQAEVSPFFIRGSWPE